MSGTSVSISRERRLRHTGRRRRGSRRIRALIPAAVAAIGLLTVLPDVTAQAGVTISPAREDTHQEADLTVQERPEDNTGQLNSAALYETAVELLSTADPADFKAGINQLERLASEDPTAAPAATVMLAWLSITGGRQNMERDLDRAMELLQSPAAHEHPVAQHLLAFAHSSGAPLFGLSVNETLAADHEAVAAEQKHPPALLGLGTRYLTGRGRPKDCELALPLYKEAAMQALQVGGLLFEEADMVTEADILHEGSAQDRQELLGLYSSMRGALADGARKGQGPVLHQLGEAYLHGHYAIPKDPEEAIKYFEAALSVGHVQSAAELGLLYAQGYTGRVSFDVIVDQLLDAVIDDARAMSVVAFMLENGLGVDVNDAKAELWYRQAAQSGDPTACYQLAERQAAKGDWKEAVGNYAAALAGRLPLAMYRIAEAYELGRFSEPSCTTASAYYYAAASAGPRAEQIHQVLDLYTEGSHEEALVMYLLAAEEGEPVAAYNAGWMMLRGEGYLGADRGQAAVRMLQLSQSDAADLLLGHTYTNGAPGLPQNLTAAAHHYRLAAQGGIAEAIRRLAKIYEAGRGVPQDLPAAQSLYLLLWESFDQLGFSGPRRGVELAKLALKLVQLRVRNAVRQLVHQGARAEPRSLGEILGLQEAPQASSTELPAPVAAGAEALGTDNPAGGLSGGDSIAKGPALLGGLSEGSHAAADGHASSTTAVVDSTGDQEVARPQMARSGLFRIQTLDSDPLCLGPSALFGPCDGAAVWAPYGMGESRRIVRAPVSPHEKESDTMYLTVQKSAARRGTLAVEALSHDQDGEAALSAGWSISDLGITMGDGWVQPALCLNVTGPGETVNVQPCINGYPPLAVVEAESVQLRVQQPSGGLCFDGQSFRPCRTGDLGLQWHLTLMDISHDQPVWQLSTFSNSAPSMQCLTLEDRSVENVVSLQSCKKLSGRQTWANEPSQGWFVSGGTVRDLPNGYCVAEDLKGAALRPCSQARTAFLHLDWPLVADLET